MNASNKPALRFKGFNDKWEEKKVSEIVGNVIGGGTPKTNIDEYWNGDIPWLQSSNLKEDEMFSFDIHKNISKLGLDNSATKLVPKNSIAVVTRVGVGKLVFVPFSYTTSQDFTSLCEIKTDISFTCYSLYLCIKNDLNNVQGSAIKGITKEDLLSKMLIIPPTTPEQEKIGAFFKQLDSLISLHQTKYDKLINIKKSLLEKMFPQHGNSTPTIRFKGFYDEWEEKKLGEVAIYTSSSLTIKDSIEDGKYELYDANGLIGFTDNFAMSEDYITIIKDGAGVGRTRKLFKNTTFIGTMGALTVKNSDLNFLFALLNKIDWNTKFTGSTIPHIYFKDYGEEKYYIPSINEQEKIGKFFQTLDHMLSLTEQKLEMLKNIKKACLEKMFV